MAPADAIGRIGPNAITRLEEALTAGHGLEACRRLFARAGLLAHLEVRPCAMVDEADVTRLHAALHDCLPDADAAAVSAEAGSRCSMTRTTHGHGSLSLAFVMR